MEWFAFSMAMASFALVMFVMEQNKKLEKRERDEVGSSEYFNDIRSTRLKGRKFLRNCPAFFVI